MGKGTSNKQKSVTGFVESGAEENTGKNVFGVKEAYMKWERKGRQEGETQGAGKRRHGPSFSMSAVEGTDRNSFRAIRLMAQANLKSPGGGGRQNQEKKRGGLQ